MDVDRLSDIMQDCEIDEILDEIQNDASGLGSTAVDLLNRLAYLDLTNGVSSELCSCIIPSQTVDFESCNVDEVVATDVLKMLLDRQLIHEKQKKNEHSVTSFRMSSRLQAKLLCKNQDNPTIVATLSVRLKKNWMESNCGYLSPENVAHVHKFLKKFNWPLNSIQSSIYFAVQLLTDRYDVDRGLAILDDVANYLKTEKCSNKADWFAVQMIRIYNDTVLKSRKILQPSDVIRVENNDGVGEDICLNNYGSWILKKIHFCWDSQLDCDTLILVGTATLDRLQKHERV